MSGRRRDVGRAADNELSLMRAKAKFLEATKEERAIQQEHKQLLIEHINECIERGHQTAYYTVPRFLIGSYDDYDVNEIAMWLVRQARRGKFEANLLPTNPPTIEVSGWHDDDWLDEFPPEKVAVAPTKKRQPSAGSTMKPKTKATTRDIGGSAMIIRAAPRSFSSLPSRSSMSGEDASRLAQTGQVSRRLQQAASRYTSS